MTASLVTKAAPVGRRVLRHANLDTASISRERFGDSKRRVTGCVSESVVRHAQFTDDNRAQPLSARLERLETFPSRP